MSADLGLLPRSALPRAAAASLAGVLLLLAPVLLSTARVASLNTAVAYAIAALGLDLLVGLTGQLSLATAAFLGVGTFTALAAGGRGAPWPVAFALAIVATAGVSALVGLPSLRIRGLQVLIATLAFQVFLVKLPQKFPQVKSVGLSFDRPGWLTSERAFAYFALAVLALALLLVARIRRTRAGRSFVAVRDVEARAAAFGISTGPTKLLAYALSGGLIGLGGAVFALQQTSVSDLTQFDIQPTLLFVAVVVIGGARSPTGTVLAALLAYALPGLLPKGYTVPFLGDPSQVVPIAFAALLVVSVVRQPTGLGGVLRDADRVATRLLAGRPDRPDPRPAATDPVSSAARARTLRKVPRGLRSRLPRPALLVAEAVSVQYGGVRALDALTLEVRRDEIVGLIGANGAGKSTFFNAVSGLAPTTGSIRYQDRELTTAPPSGRSGAGLARTFQDMGLVRGDTVRENLLLAQGWMARYPAAAGLLGLFGAVGDERLLRQRADVALDLFGLRHLAAERLGDLPYGTMRIVEIAAAVAAGPDLLLLDEASAGLTPEEAHQLGDRFRALRDELGLTLVVIEHHVPLIASVCDYCYCLESGRLIAEGSPAEVTAQPQVVESFLGRGSLTPRPEPSPLPAIRPVARRPVRAGR